MDQNRRIRHFCAAMLLWTMVFRLCTAGIPERFLSWLSQPDTVRFLIYLETGRIVRFSSSEEAVPAFFRESAPPVLPETRPAFSGEEGEKVEFSYLCAYRPDAAGLLTKPLEIRCHTVCSGSSTTV
jgi:hypothetical protein